MRKRVLFAALALTLFLMGAAAVPGVSRTQLQAQITLFDAAVRQLGASSPEEAALLWAKGDQTRNGVFQYAAADDSLKKRIADRLGSPEKSYWNIGVSSPWVSDVKIEKTVRNAGDEAEVTLLYHWATSAGPAEPTRITLRIKENGVRWQVYRTVPAVY